MTRPGRTQLGSAMAGRGSLGCEEDAVVVTILLPGRKARSLPRESFNSIAGVNRPGTLVPGVHGVRNSARRPAVTDASQRADAGVCKSIGIGIELLKQTVVSRSCADDKQRSAVDRPDIAATIDAGQLHRSATESC